MSRPNPTARGTSKSPMKIKTNQPATIEPNVSQTKNLHSLKKIEEVLLKNNEQSPKTIALSHSTPDKNKNNSEKKTIKMIPVSNIEIQSVQQIPKVQSSSNTPRQQVKNLPKLQMTKKDEASNTNTQKLQAKEHSATSQKSKKSSSSSLSNEKPSSSNVLPVSISNETSTNQSSTNVQSKMKNSPAIKPESSGVVNTSKNNNKLNPETVTAKHNETVLKEQKNQFSKEKQSNKPSTFDDYLKIEERRKRELNDRKRKRCRARGIDPIDNDPRVEYTYIADGLREDCEILVEKCLQVYKLNFEKFCEIWKQMDFPSIFNERPSCSEIAELSEEVIHVAKVHMVAKNVNFEENIVGLFLVYAFLNNQPYKEFAALRLVPTDVPAIKHLETEARKQRRHDVLYILGKVLIQGPCQYHVLAREVALEMPIRKYFNGSIQLLRPTVESVCSKTSECVQFFKEVALSDQSYSAVRQKLRGKIPHLSTQPAASLFNLFRNQVPGGMICEQHIESVLNKSNAPVQEKDRHNLVQTIKDKAMTKIVDPMKHLTGVEERHDKSFSPEKVKEKKVKETKVGSKPHTRHKSKVKRKGPSRRRGRGSALVLQELFCTEEDEEDQVTADEEDQVMAGEKDQVMADEEVLPQTSRKEMPIIDTTGNLITDTDLPSLSSPNNNEKLSKVESWISKNESKHKKGQVRAKARNLEMNSSKTEAKDKKVNKPAIKDDKTEKKQEHKVLSDQDFDKIDISPLTIFLHEKPVIETKLDEKNKSHNQVFGKSKKVENDAKDKKNNGHNSMELHFYEQDINIDLDLMPVEIHPANENIEIDIIDNFKRGIGTLEGDEEMNDKDASVTKSDSNRKEVEDSSSGLD